MRVIIGDQMQSFATATEAMTFSQCLQTPCQADAIYIAGQGLDIEQINALQQFCTRHNAHLIRAVDPTHRATGNITHKHNHRNGLISFPVALADGVFESELLVDDQGELLLDHATGCHLQGMVLIEAIRQMFIAVAETGYKTQGVPNNGYVVFNSIDIRFNSFAFPTAAVIRHTTQHFKIKRAGYATFKALIEVVQNGIVVADADVAFAVFSHALLTPKEIQKAQEALKVFTEKAQQLAQLNTPPPTPTMQMIKEATGACA